MPFEPSSSRTSVPSAPEKRYARPARPAVTSIRPSAFTSPGPQRLPPKIEPPEIGSSQCAKTEPSAPDSNSTCDVPGPVTTAAARSGMPSPLASPRPASAWPSFAPAAGPCTVKSVEPSAPDTRRREPESVPLPSASRAPIARSERPSPSTSPALASADPN